MRNPIKWLEQGLRLMCQQGLHGVIAAGIIVSLLLNAPFAILQAFGFIHYFNFVDHLP